MASKKKRNRSRPPSGSRLPAKPPGQPAAAATPPGAAKASTKPSAGGQAKAAGGQAKASAGQAKPSSGGHAKAAAGGQAKPASSGQAKGRKSGTPRERTGPTRAERLAAAETARRRKAARTRTLVYGGIVALLALITVTVLNSRRSNTRVVSQLEASGACEYDSRTDSDGGIGRNHVTGDITYEVQPPAGGDHDPAPAGPGVYTLQSKPTDSKIVHAMEHGDVVIWHRPDLDPAVLDQLRGFVDRYDRDVLLVPRESLEQPVAATAWHRRLLCSRPDVAAAERFVTAYRDKGPESPPE